MTVNANQVKSKPSLATTELFQELRSYGTKFYNKKYKTLI